MKRGSRFEKCFLNNILRRGSAVQHAATIAKDARPITFVHLAERCLVTSLYGSNKLGIGYHDGFSDMVRYDAFSFVKMHRTRKSCRA